ncbi:Gfo/Idh/MocA family oxidoreductase [Streptomyces sp. CAU 1734]|uniref:Gfo/Idh/MocA family protein n=1 Tax=Streptomyces sp. CAU 1734 TaxID=3140360 RepID=UPI00326176E9
MSDNPGEKLRFGLFGAGPWAEHTHAPALAAHAGVDFAGVWARRPEAAAALAAAHGTAAYSGDDGARELLAACDAAAFALPPDIQARFAVLAAEAGCHLLLDKPVATSVAEARAAADAAARASVSSVVLCTLRFSGLTAPWIREQAALGGWFTAHAQWLGSLYAPDSRSRYAASPWRRDKGGLWDVGPHVLSVLLPILGEVTGLTAARGPRDTAHLVLRHDSGASSTVTVGLGAPAKGAGASIQLVGDQGRATIPEWSDPVSSYGAAIGELRSAIATGRPHECDVRFGLRLTELLAEAERQLGRERGDAPFA